MIHIFRKKARIFHGAMVDGEGNEDLTLAALKNFNSLVFFKNLATVYFTDKWALNPNLQAPVSKCEIAYSQGAVPFIRLQNSEDPDGAPGSMGRFSHSSIVYGKWDTQLKKYAADLQALNNPVILEYGTEINGDWFCWSVDEGPELFKKAFRHLYKIFNNKNIEFAFHVDATDNPHSKGWYPGDDVVSWVGTSCYGGYGSGRGCIDSLDLCYKDFASISKTAKLGIFEWGAPEPKDIEFNVKDTVKTLEGIPKKYPKIKLLQRWCEKILTSHTEDEIGDGRIDVTPEMLKAYKDGIVYNPAYLPIYTNP